MGRGVLPISRENLKILLQLPENYKIQAVYFDISRETLVLVLESDDIPETPDGKPSPEVLLQGHKRKDSDGKEWQRLEIVGVKSFEERVSSCRNIRSNNSG